MKTLNVQEIVRKMLLQDMSPMPNDFHIVAIRPYSCNEDDTYLSVVLCQLEVPDDKVSKYVVWTYNWQDGGFSLGHYFFPEEAAKAMECFLRC